MTQLIFGDPESIKLAKQGEIPNDVLDKESVYYKKEGCEEACQHCDEGEWYTCGNDDCSMDGESLRQVTMKDLEGKVRCKGCKYIITTVECQ